MTPSELEAATELIRLLMGAAYRAGKFAVKGTRAEFDAAVATENEAHAALLTVLRGVGEREAIEVEEAGPHPLAPVCLRCGFQHSRFASRDVCPEGEAAR